ncbi:membrane protein [Neorhizobium sp. NCHU2750]|nr:membrane protein [Neorhizobium sp. NCHU2750]
MDAQSGRLHLGPWQIPMPRSKAGRIGIGSALMVGGALGFLPVLGFWMLPLGFVVLSNDIAFVRRRRRRIVVWWAKRRDRTSASADGSGNSRDEGRDKRQDATGHSGSDTKDFMAR